MKTFTEVLDVLVLAFCFLGAVAPKQLAQLVAPIKFVRVSASSSGYALLFAVCLWGLVGNVFAAAGAGLLLWLAARATRSSQMLKSPKTGA